MQVVLLLVYFEWFRRNSHLKCVLQPKIAKNSLKPLFWGSGSFKVIDVGTPGKPVISACYDAQQVCVCLSATILVLVKSTVAEIALLQEGTQI